MFRRACDTAEVRAELVVSLYDPRWPEMFQYLRRRLLRHVEDLVLAIEHVGSTAVPGCAAKPIIDLDIVLRDAALMPELIARLTEQDGYQHEGDLGIPGREAFAKRSPVRHHLYGVVVDTKPYLDHILLRDYLRTHPAAVRRYSELKLSPVTELGVDSAARDAYPVAKSGFVEDLLGKAHAA